MSYILRDKLAAARLAYRQLMPAGALSGTLFFEAFGVGNKPYPVDRPYEKFNDYEVLLKILREDDPEKYKKIHKGNPFYFLSWTAFHMKHYEKAVFYMDAAVSEDQANCRPQWEKTPAGCFIFLNEEGDQAAKEFTEDLKQKIKAQIERFNLLSPPDILEWNSFLEHFIKRLARGGCERSILTAFYSFILEHQDRQAMLELRSSGGGSIEPFLVHLFKGGVIFESILKDRYKSNDQRRTIEKIFKYEKKFRRDFNIADRETFDTSAHDLIDIIKYCRGKSGAKIAFETTAKIRNCSGHDLARADRFLKNPSNYSDLYEQEMNAVLYLIAKGCAEQAKKGP